MVIVLTFPLDAQCGSRTIAQRIVLSAVLDMHAVIQSWIALQRFLIEGFTEFGQGIFS
jgi:hypothetical protein